MSEYSVIGKPIPDFGLGEKVHGTATYTTDIALPGMLYGKVLRSKVAHARVRRIDAGKAKRLAGVKAIITGKDLPPVLWGVVLKDKYLFAVDKVRFIGDEVAGIVATDEDIAEEAADLIEVEYEELPAVFDPKEAMKAEAPLLHENLEKYEHISSAKPLPHTNICSKFTLVHGNVDAGFKRADYIFEDEFGVPAMHNAAMEPLACLARVDTDNNVTIWSSTQSPYEVRDAIAEYLGMAANKVRVIVPFLGGGFGGKYHLKGELICAVMSKFAGRPVKLVYSREETLVSGGVRHPATIKVKTGIKKDGTITARHLTEIFNCGAYADAGPRVMWRGLQSGGGPYRIPDVLVDSYGVYTNNPPACPFRGFGTNHPTWATETQMDMIAAKLKLDPLEFRLKNALVEGDTCATGQPASAVGMKECLNTLEQVGHWSKSRSGRKKLTGVGVACFHKSTNTPTSGSALVKLNQDGSADLVVSLADMGQGTPTVLAQIVAEELGVPVNKIRVSQPDTNATPPYIATTGSRAAFVLGNAVKNAAVAARKEVLNIASQVMGAPVDALMVKDGKVVRRDAPEKFMPFTALPIGGGKFVGGVGYPVAASGYFSSATRETVPNLETAQAVKSSLFWMYGAHLAEVEVDADTGKVKINRILAVHNVGKALNPAIVEGQCEGGVSMAIGEALSEQFIRQNGETLNSSFCDYKMPQFAETPDKMQTVLVEVPHKESAYGNIGVGEAVVLGAAAAIGNAVFDAVGVRITDLPVTPEKIVMALREKKESKGQS